MGDKNDLRIDKDPKIKTEALEIKRAIEIADSGTLKVLISSLLKKSFILKVKLNIKVKRSGNEHKKQKYYWMA